MANLDRNLPFSFTVLMRSVFICQVLVLIEVAGNLQPVTAGQLTPAQIQASCGEAVVFLEVHRTPKAGGREHIETGTGFIITPYGDVLTSAHLLPDPNEYDTNILGINWHRGSPKYELNVVVPRDANVDVALLRLPNNPIAGTRWPFVRILDTWEVSSDVNLTALGFPLESDLSVNSGHLSNASANDWQVDIALNYGNSGGPVFDDQGQVVAIVKGGIFAAQRINYVIPMAATATLRTHTHQPGRSRCCSEGSYDSSNILYAQARDEHAEGHDASALNTLNQIIPGDEYYLNAMMLKGHIFLDGSNYLIAIEAFKQARLVATQDFQRSNADFDIALCYNYVREFAKAAPILLDLLRKPLYQDDPQTIYNAAAALNGMGDIQGAIRVLSKYPFGKPIPEDSSWQGKDVQAKAYWLHAALSVANPATPCLAVTQDLQHAKALSPSLSVVIDQEFANEQKYRRCLLPRS